MIRLKRLVVPTFALSVAFTSIALANDETSTPIPDARQTKLLERFGDQGIDADDDGTLTCAEVRAFFADKRLKGETDGCGMRGMKDCGRHDGKGHGRGPGACGHHDGKGHGRGPGACGYHDGECHGRGPGACGHHGMCGDDRGPMGGVGRLMHRFDMLEAETPPAEFDLARFPEADLDGNGELSDGEWAAFTEQARSRVLARLMSRFPDADADGDGSICEAELATLKANVRERCLARHPDADTDGDGVLSDDEFQAFKANRAEECRARAFKHHPEADLDGDGVLSVEEARSFKGGHRGRLGAGRGHCGK